MLTVGAILFIFVCLAPIPFWEWLPRGQLHVLLCVTSFILLVKSTDILILTVHNVCIVVVCVTGFILLHVV